MEESVTYQAIVEKGVAIGEKRALANEARDILLKVGAQRFGKNPPPTVLSKLKKIDDKRRLEDLVLRALVAKNWNELLN